MAVNQRGCRRISVMIGGCPELVGVGEGERTIGRREVEIRLGFFFWAESGNSGYIRGTKYVKKHVTLCFQNNVM